MKMNKHALRYALAGISAAVAMALPVLTGSIIGGATPLQGADPSYTIDMDASNAPTTSALYAAAEREIRNNTFEYYGARASSGKHVELNSTGYLMNALDSRITSITSVTAVFTTSGSLSLATSFDGQTFSSTTIASGVTNQITSLPYYLRLTANSSSVAIASVAITYSCAPHADPIGEEVRYDIVVKDFACTNTGTDISSAMASNFSTYFTSEIAISSFSGTKLFGNTTPTAASIKAGSSTAVGSLTFSFASTKVSQVIVNTMKYGSDTVSIKVTSSADSTGATKSITSTAAMDYTFDLDDASSATSVTIAGVGKRFYLEQLTLVSEGTASSSPIETGFSASDANASSYTASSVYSTANGLAAQAMMTSGSSVALSYDATGLNGYSYVVKNSLGNQISAATAFGEAGTYYAVVSYKSYTPITIELIVVETPVKTLTSVAATDSNATYQIGDIYDEDNALVVTATYSDSSTATLSYDATGTDGYTLYCLDPNADEFYTSNAFSLAGDYILTASYKGVESNQVEFAVQAASGGVTEASISISTIAASDSTSIVTGLQNSPSTYLSATGVTISSVTASTIYGGGGQARMRFTSSGTAGSLRITFAAEAVINSISLSVSQYLSKSSSVKVVTGANTTGQSMTVSGTTTLAYTAFSSDIGASTSITISSASSNQFYLHGITLSLGAQDPVAVTGVSLKASTSLSIGGIETLTPTIAPTNATNKSVTWDTSNTGVASVNNGLVTANAIGMATITVTTVDGGFTAQCAVTVTEAQYDNYYKATSVDPNFNYQDLHRAQDCNSIPTPRTDLNILVVPMELSDYPFTTATTNRIATMFNGTAAETNYWQSVSSFYNESSYGNLDINFTVAPKYATGYTAAQAAALDTSDTQYFTTNLLRNAVSNYKATNGNTSTQQFDADDDGFIDAVWMIYSCPNYSNSSTIEGISTDYWAYVFWDYSQTASTSSPVANAYGWASYDFMDEGGGASVIDAHTYIHETGHLLGLDDYYNYDESSTYKPTGGIDMMDYNVTDHNVWSKMALGWTKPYVVTGDAEITIDPAEASGDAILIADSWNGTSFDEFLMLELYTPTGLNQLDSSTAYSGTYPRGYITPGVRMYHVDSRIAKYSYSTSWYFNGYYEPTSLTLTGNNYYGVAHSNTPSSTATTGYRLIHMIQATGTNTFDTGSTGVNADLFTTGKTFSMAANGAQFFQNGALLNNGNALGYTIQFVSVSATSATIRILKI